MPSPRLHGEPTYDGKCTVTGAEIFDISGAVHLARLSGQAAITEGQLSQCSRMTTPWEL